MSAPADGLCGVCSGVGVIGDEESWEPCPWCSRPTPAPAAGTGDERGQLREAVVASLIATKEGRLGYIDADRMADALLTGPLANLLSAQEAVRRVRSECEAVAIRAPGSQFIHADVIRRALDGTEGASQR